MPDDARQGLKRIRAALSWRGLMLFGFGPALALLTLAGVFVPADRLIGDLNYSLWSRPAADDLVLVEMDGASLQKIGRWPWPRAYHAALIQRLSQAGAETIAFDVDFSTQQKPADDAALALAIAGSKSRIVLASFRQANGDLKPLLNLPLPAFRAHAQLGFVNAVADEDGILRGYLQDDDSMATVLAGWVAAGQNAFLVDYSIDPRSIARIAYVDVLSGRFDPAVVAGKKVLIGATAAEIPDRFNVPKYHTLNGVEYQALAYSSVVGDRMIHTAGDAWVLLGLGVVLIAGVWLDGRGWRRQLFVAGAAAAAALGLGFVLQTAFAIALPVAPWLAAIAGWALLTLIRSVRRHSRAAALHRAAAARQKALMEGVFNDSSDGILIAGDDGRVLVANGAAEHMLETAKAALAGQAVGAILDGLALMPQAAAEVTVATGSGRALGLAVSVTRSQSAAGNGDDQSVWIVTFRDESAKRALEAARDATIRELQAATAAKNEFLARISHELRTPLSAIIGFSTMIGDQSLGAVGNPKYVEYARDIHSGGKRLLELVNDIIDITRIEAEQYEIRPDVFEVRSLLGACCFAARESEACGEKNIRFEVLPGAEAIQSDRQALAKVIAKLLSNAIKFTGPQGDILLRAAAAVDRTIVFEVVDNGIGIAPAALKNVTSAFSQVRGGLDRHHEGAGLGLYLAHRMMLLLGGKLEIESLPGQGTTVRLSIPGALIEASQAA
ncbi:CHASE2 domain-containing protein [Dongia sp.]|uniref:CHASE2 domain-containing protein n=1 Tax=Dongia sp. TaxID=1977262 RepID=UPI003752F39A